MKRLKLFTIIIAVITLAALSLSCEKKVGKDPSLGDASFVKCDTVTYKKHIQPFIESTCAKSGCHNSATKAGNVEFTSYSAVKVQVDNGRIKARVFDGTPSYMPQDLGKLPLRQLNMIQCWIDKGAPEN